MKVRAIRKGHYEIIRDVGDVFDITPNMFSSRWMEKVENFSGSKKGGKAETFVEQ